MAANTKQKVDTINIGSDIKADIEAKFANGWVMQQIVNLQPGQNKVLIIYVKPDKIEPEPEIQT